MQYSAYYLLSNGSHSCSHDAAQTASPDTSPERTAACTQLVTAPVYAAMKREIRARQDGGWARVEWALPTLPQLRDLEVVHGRMLYLNPKVGVSHAGWAQMYISRSRLLVHTSHVSYVSWWLASMPDFEHAAVSSTVC